jgi:hypothetical protein
LAERFFWCFFGLIQSIQGGRSNETTVDYYEAEEDEAERRADFGADRL